MIKYISILFITLMTICSATAQDTSTCQRLMTLTSRYGKKKLPTRCITKSSNYGMEMVSQQDTFQNTHSITQFSMGGFKKKTEMIIFDQKGYVRIDTGEWKIVDISAYTNMNTYMPTVNLQNPIYKNCKQLSNEKIEGEDCSVFEIEMDKDFSMNGNTNNVKSKMKLWINSGGLSQKMTNTMNQLNTTIIMESKFEYDETIKITAPIK